MIFLIGMIDDRTDPASRVRYEAQELRRSIGCFAGSVYSKSALRPFVKWLGGSKCDRVG